MEAEKVAAGYEKETIARKSTAKEKEAGKERKAEVLLLFKLCAHCQFFVFTSLL